MPLTCLDTIIGLTGKTCDCFDDGRPVGYNTSDSGYFITDNEYGFPIKHAVFENTDCNDTFWGAMQEAKDKAISSFKLDLRRTLALVRDKQIGSWNGLIGRTKQDATVFVSDSTVGIQIRPKRLRDAYLALKGVWFGLDTTLADVTLTISSNDPAFTPITQSLSSVAGQFNQVAFESEIRLPLYSDSQDQLYYYLEYEPGAAKPLNNDLWCGCSGEGWKKSLKVGSYAHSNASTFNEFGKYTGKKAYGLAFDAYIDCANLDWICNLTELNGFDMRDMIARSVQMKAAVKLIAYVLDSGRVNRYSVLEADNLTAKAQHLSELYARNVNWIAEHLPANITACWGCKKGQPQIASILT